jgi:hypothetical protein
MIVADKMDDVGGLPAAADTQARAVALLPRLAE